MSSGGIKSRETELNNLDIKILQFEQKVGQMKMAVFGIYVPLLVDELLKHRQLAVVENDHKALFEYIFARGSKYVLSASPHETYLYQLGVRTATTSDHRTFVSFFNAELVQRGIEVHLLAEPGWEKVRIEKTYDPSKQGARRYLNQIGM